MRITVGDRARMEGTDHVMVDGDGVKSRFNDWQPVSTPLRKYLGGPAGDRVSQVRGLGGGTEVLRLHANAQGFVAAVFADSSIGKFVVNQERERSMLDAGYVLRADEIPDDLWAVIEPVLLPSLAGRRVLPWNDHRLPLDGKNPVMTAFSLRAARIQLGALLAALTLAIVMALGITTGAFVLSFAVQRDLARQALIPEHLTWIFPAIVDSAILGATIAIVIISKLT